jgi:hypothetical protein
MRRIRGRKRSAGVPSAELASVFSEKFALPAKCWQGAEKFPPISAKGFHLSFRPVFAESDLRNFFR